MGVIGSECVWTLTFRTYFYFVASGRVGNALVRLLDFVREGFSKSGVSFGQRRYEMTLKHCHF